MDIINRLTEKIDSYADNNHWGTGADVHTNLWADLAELRNFKPNRRANMIRDWKYKTEFESTEQDHVNGQRIFQLLPWEQSYVVALLFARYH